MDIPVLATPSWSTASFGDTPEASANELSVLGEHVERCKALTGRLFAAQCVAEVMHSFVASRFVTTLVAVAILFTISSLIM